MSKSSKPAPSLDKKSFPFPESLVQPLTNNAQTIDHHLVYLGIDTEMLMKRNDEYLWPHQHDMKQTRMEGTQHVSFDWHADGFAHELCTSPRSCIEELSRGVSVGLGDLVAKYRPPYTPPPLPPPVVDQWGYRSYPPPPPAPPHGVSIDVPALYKVPQHVVDSAPAEVKRLGCLPSSNVYGNPGKPGALSSTMRTTGCHLHLSHPTLQGANGADIARRLVMWADILVGCVWTYISPESPKLERARRRAYGRAGEHRLKLYPTYPKGFLDRQYSAGVEYRVLPGTILRHPVYFSLSFNLYRTALKVAIECPEPNEMLSALAMEIINKSDKKLAYLLIDAIPMDERARAYIHWLASTPLQQASIDEWCRMTEENRLHRYHSQYQFTAAQRTGKTTIGVSARSERVVEAVRMDGETLR